MASSLAILPSSAEEYPCDRAIPVFQATGEPYRSIRIPFLLQVKNGRLLSLAEGRYANTDQGKNDIIMSMSDDDGKTWSKAVSIADAKGATYNNPCPVYDAKSGAIYVFFQRYPSGISERAANIPTGWKDPKAVLNFVIKSTDNGKTWSQPVNVTPTTKRADGVPIMAGGPNAGIQLKDGPKRGRMVIPVNEGPFDKWDITSVYSDNGKDWKIGNPAPDSKDSNGFSRVNETALAETDNGGIVMVARHWGGGDRRRITWSKDGGVTWSPVKDAKDLFCCNTQGTLLSYSLTKDPKFGRKSRLLFAAPGGPQRRHNGKVYLSYDNGRTWPISKNLNQEKYCYSSLAHVGKNGEVGLLYETDDSKEIRFTTFTIDWLTDGKDKIILPKRR